MSAKEQRADQSKFPPTLRLEFQPNARSTRYRVSAAPWGQETPGGRRLVDSGWLDVALPGLADLGLTDTIALLSDSLLATRARVSADGGGFPEGPHRWSQAPLPGL